MPNISIAVVPRCHEAQTDCCLGRLSFYAENVTEEQERWAAAAMVLKQHGDRAPLFVAELIGALALAGETDGIALWQDIATKLWSLRDGQRQ